MNEVFKDWLRSSFYGLGLFGLVHRLRNRNTLTVLMFHRVLPENSAAYERCEHEFALTVDGFSRCIDFVKKHYEVLGLSEVKEAIRGKTRFPNRAALITFDDGWRDTLEYALPVLAEREVPAVLFLATEVPSLEGNRWWQDALVESLALPDGRNRLVALFDPDGAGDSDVSKRLAAKLSELPDTLRSQHLDPYVSWTPGSRQMLSLQDLALLEPWLAVAGHGHSHGPLTECRRPGEDLRRCREALCAIGADAEIMAFPHGAYNPEIADEARNLGFNLLFSSDPYLTSTRGLSLGDRIIGRIHIPENQWTCDARGVSNPKLATFLFFREIAG